jgi:hypothetical protein
MEMFNINRARDLSVQAQKRILIEFTQKIKTEIEKMASAGARKERKEMEKNNED